MTEPSTFLDKIGVATPCEASWDAMEGDERVRYCGSCRLSVYNLSAMSRREAEDLVRNRHGAGAGERLCVKFFRRADGTLVTDECGRVRRALRRKALLIRTAAAALFALVLSPLLAACGAGGEKPTPGVTTHATPSPTGVAPAAAAASTPLQAAPSHQVPGGEIPAPVPTETAAPRPEEVIELMGDVCVPEELLQPDPPEPTEK